MSEIPDSRIILAIDLKKNRLRIHRTALKQLGEDKYVCFPLSTLSRMEEAHA